MKRFHVRAVRDLSTPDMPSQFIHLQTWRGLDTLTSLMWHAVIPPTRSPGRTPNLRGHAHVGRFPTGGYQREGTAVHQRCAPHRALS